MVPEEKLIRRMHGKTMTFAVSDMNLDSFVEMVRERTGANIVINRGTVQPSVRKVSLVLNCVSTLNALRLAAEFEDLCVTCFDNIYVIGVKEKIDKLNIDVSKSIFVKEISKMHHMPVDQDGKIINEGPCFGNVDLKRRPVYIPVLSQRTRPQKQEPKK